MDSWHLSSLVIVSFKFICVCVYFSLLEMPNTYPLNLITFKITEWQRRGTGSQRPLCPMASRLNSAHRPWHALCMPMSPLGRVLNLRQAESRTVRVALQGKVHLRSRKYRMKERIRPPLNSCNLAITEWGQMDFFGVKSFFKKKNALLCLLGYFPWPADY